MSRETKIGLLVGLGIILVFALILQWTLTSRHANLGEEAEGMHIVQAAIPDTEPVGPAGTAGPAADLTARSDTLAATDFAPPSTEATPDTHSDGTIVVNRGGADTPFVTGLGGPGSTGATSAEAPAEHVGRPGDAILPPAEPVTPTYTVQAGDTGAKIAEKVFGAGQGAKWKLIAKLNPKVDATRLKVGAKLTIPAEATERRTDVALDTSVGVAPRDDGASTKRTYVVAQGDTLGTISTKVYGTCKKWQLIADANKGLNPKSLKVGAKLAIPEAPAAASPPIPAIPASPATPLTPAPTVPSAPASPGGPTRPTSLEPMVAGGGATSGGATPLHTLAGSAPAGTGTAPGHSPIVTVPVPTTLPSLDDVTPPAHPLAAASGETYKVQARDTLATISQKVLGSSARWKEIYALNRDKLPDPKKLTIGQELRLPTGTRVAMADVVR